MAEVDILTVYFFGSVSCAAFCSFILILKGAKAPLDIRLIGFALIIASVYAFMTIMLFEGVLLDYPWLFRLFYPLYFLIGPCIFFFVRHACLGKAITFKQDFIHLLPSVLAAINLIPFYLISLEEKRLFLEIIRVYPLLSIELGAGFLPIVYSNIIKGLLFLLYGLASLKILLFTSKVRFSVAKHPKSIPILRGAVTFLLIIALIFLWINVSQLFNSGTLELRQLSGSGLQIQFALHTFLLLTTFYFFFMPEGIFSLPESVFVNGNKQDADLLTPILVPSEPELSTAAVDHADPVPLSSEEKALLIRLIYGMEMEHWYKTKNFSAKDCAVLLGIEKHQLSGLFRKAIPKRFTDFVNGYRIDFVKFQIKEGKLKKFTLEALAQEAGFNSRTTFYNAFLKAEGVNPSRFVEQLQG
jgi:AraC-like DNA-binding protein